MFRQAQHDNGRTTFWTPSKPSADPRVVKDAHGNVLGNGDHEISCKMDGIAVGLKACFVKKA